jgi:putative FmdB family regulatory protein
MPLYEYRCQSCGHQFEVIQKFSDALIAVCPKCGAGPVVKLLSSPAIQFKGSGFYITDYARKDGGSKDAGKEAGKDSSKDKDRGKSADTTSSATTTSSSDSSSSTAPAPKSDTPSTGKS